LGERPNAELASRIPAVYTAKIAHPDVNLPYRHPALVFPRDWTDYEVLATGEGLKKERWGTNTLLRPDPQAIWAAPKAGWGTVDGHYNRSATGGGAWTFTKRLPDAWNVRWKALTFKIRPTDFKHTGLFPEQASNWAWMQSLIRDAGRPVQMLNLFGYTGAASVAAAAAGASVTHVDAAKGMVHWCRENAELSGLGKAPIRYIVDDCVKFVEKEVRRGKQYDLILLDPPVFGRGAANEVWKIETHLWPLLEKCRALLTPKPLGVLLNTYTAGLSPVVTGNLLADLASGRAAQIDVFELGLPVPSEHRILPCGVTGRLVFA